MARQIPIDEEEIYFLEKGLALEIANLDYASELLSTTDFSDLEELNRIVRALEEVSDFDKLDDLDREMMQISERFKQSKLNDNLELYFLLTEPYLLNKHLRTLLLSSDYRNMDVKIVSKYLFDNLHTAIQKILDLPNVNELVNKEGLSILKILQKEENFDDLMEGWAIVILYLTNSFSYNEKTSDFYLLVVEVDLLLSFINFLNEDDEPIEE